MVYRTARRVMHGSVAAQVCKPVTEVLGVRHPQRFGALGMGVGFEPLVAGRLHLGVKPLGLFDFGDRNHGLALGVFLLGGALGTSVLWARLRAGGWVFSCVFTIQRGQNTSPAGSSFCKRA